MYKTFLSIFLETYETNIPYKQVTVKSKDVKSFDEKNVGKIIYSGAKIVC